jgi:hypothetical protein
MTTVAILLCSYLLTGLAIAGACDGIFIKDGLNKYCFSRQEFALLAVAWPYYVFGELWERD